jgi:hypothetical protein
MKLYELAYCCRLYGQLTGYDRHLSQLHQRVGSGLDPSNPAHRTALFQWLNGWGCRQFARQHHATTASDSLVRWADAWLGRLPAWPVQLTDLSVPELELCAGAYDALRVLPASRRTLNSGKVSVVTYGPTGTAKTLFALRPNVFPPWDTPIRRLFGLDGDGASFRRYLTEVASTVREVAAEAGIPVAALPELVERPTPVRRSSSTSTTGSSGPGAVRRQHRRRSCGGRSGRGWRRHDGNHDPGDGRERREVSG